MIDERQTLPATKSEKKPRITGVFLSFAAKPEN
jgi:hypothetical protein